MKRFASNFFSILGADIVRRLLGFLTFAYLARRISPDDFGIVNIGFTVLSYALMISSAGLTTLGAREVARNASGQLVNSFLSLRLVLATGCYGCIIVIAQVFVQNALAGKLITIFALSLFAHALSLEWFFQGREAMGIIAVGRSIAAAVYLIIVVLFVHASTDLAWAAGGVVASDVIATMILMATYRSRFHERAIRFSLFGWRSSLRQAVSMGAGSVLGDLSINLPPILIAVTLSNADVGIYSAASKIVVFLLMLDRVFGTILLPATARLHASSPELLSSELNGAARWILLGALPLCLGGTILADRLLPFVFGEPYRAAAPVLQVLIWYCFFTMLHTLYTSGMIAIGMERAYSRVMMTSFVLYAVTILAGTKFFGIVGSAAAVALSESATLLLMRRAFHRTIKTRMPARSFGIIMSAAAMGGILLILPPMHVVFAVAFGAGAYIAFLFAVRALTPADLSALMERV